MAGSLEETPSITVWFVAWSLGSKFRADLISSLSFANSDQRCTDLNTTVSRAQKKGKMLMSESPPEASLCPFSQAASFTWRIFPVSLPLFLPSYRWYLSISCTSTSQECIMPKINWIIKIQRRHMQIQQILWHGNFSILLSNKRHENTVAEPDCHISDFL